MALADSPDIYIVHGWKIGPDVLTAVLTNMSPEILESGLRVVIQEGSKERAFLGEVLAVLRPKKGGVFSPVAPPDDGKKLIEAAKSIGLGAMVAETGPTLWIVAG